MNTGKFPAKAEGSPPSNVLPFRRPARDNRRTLGVLPFRSWGAHTRSTEANALELELPEERLGRRVERVLGALLYHAAPEAGDLRHTNVASIEQRASRLIPHEQLMAIAYAAISLGLDGDLTRLAAVAISFELQAQSRWRNRLLCLASSQRRQVHQDTLAIARLLAWELDALKLRPIDQFAKFL